MQDIDLYKEYQTMQDLVLRYAAGWQGDAAEAHLLEAEDLLEMAEERFHDCASAVGSASGSAGEALMEDFLL